MDHSTHSCAHNALKFCSHCNTVWCQACKIEWRQNPICLMNHYPNYYQQYWRYQTYSSGGTFGSSSTVSIGGSAQDMGSTLTTAVVPCTHGGK